MALSMSGTSSSAVSVTGTSLFACFESGKLLPYISSNTQLTIVEANKTSIWDLVTVEWLTKIKSIIDKSIESPKSLFKLMQVVDLWRRATVGYLEFRAAGAGECQVLPDWLSESAAEEVRSVERRAAEVQGNKILLAGGVFWFCDADVLVESDPFTTGELATWGPDVRWK